MRHIRRKTAPGVANGRVRRKNRHATTPNYYNTPQDVPVIDRARPGPGHRHVLKKRDVIDFISILPDWEEFSKGLNAILLATADDDADGWHTPGIVAVCAWPRELWVDCTAKYYEDHRDIFKRLGVPTRRSKGGMVCKFTESTVKAYQLLHVLLHELGHHHDRMTTRSQKEASRGEGYAEWYAHEYEKTIWERYLGTFGLE